MPVIKLAASFAKAGNVLLPFVFEQFADPLGNPDKPLPKYASDQSVPAVPRLTHGMNPTFPVAELAAAANGMAERGSSTAKLLPRCDDVRAGAIHPELPP